MRTLNPNRQLKAFKRVAERFEWAVSKYPKFIIKKTNRNTLQLYNQRKNNEQLTGCVPIFYALSFNRPKEVTREDGIIWLTQDLGFKEPLHLQKFMADFPQVWGNRRGEGLFKRPSSYNKINQESLSLPLYGEDVAYHWNEVSKNFCDFYYKAILGIKTLF